MTTKLSFVTSHISFMTSHISFVTSQIPVVTSQIPFVTSQIPFVTSHIPFVTSQIPFVCCQIHAYINTFNSRKRKRDVIDESFYGENDDNLKRDESEGGHLDNLKDLIRPSETHKEVFQTQSHINKDFKDKSQSEKNPEIETISGNVPDHSELHDLQGTRNEETRISESENPPLVNLNVLSSFLSVSLSCYLSFFFFFFSFFLCVFLSFFLCLSRFVSLSVSLSFSLYNRNEETRISERENLPLLNFNGRFIQVSFLSIFLCLFLCLFLFLSLSL
jgi:hypothetical protein